MGLDTKAREISQSKRTKVKADDRCPIIGQLTRRENSLA